MKILICSYEKNLIKKMDYEIQCLNQYLPEAEIVVKQYVDQESFIKHLDGVDALLTVFIPINADVLKVAKSLKIISLSSTGYSNIDIKTASELGIKICNIYEYCTNEVADHAMALILTLGRKLKQYEKSINIDKIWQFDIASPVLRFSEHILGIYGLGRIGQAIAKRAKAFGMKVVAVDPYIPVDVAKKLGVELVDDTYIQQYATIISNHMNVTNENVNYFDQSYFQKLKCQPIFINVSRGESVNQNDLINALENGFIIGAGIDVLDSENPNLDNLPLLGMDNVIVTPHAAFYSEQSIMDLKHISVMNLIYALNEEHEQVFAYVNYNSDLQY